MTDQAIGANFDMQRFRRFEEQWGSNPAELARLREYEQREREREQAEAEAPEGAGYE